MAPDAEAEPLVSPVAEQRSGWAVSAASLEPAGSS